jgi:hypothetical protein
MTWPLPKCDAPTGKAEIVWCLMMVLGSILGEWGSVLFVSALSGTRAYVSIYAD